MTTAMGEGRDRDAAEWYATAVGLLARREHSSRELREKLRLRGADAALAESVVARLADERLQSDERFAEAYVRMRSERGYGPLRIAAELRERGIEDDLIMLWLRSGDDGVVIDWFERAEAAYARKFGGRPIVDSRDRAKRMRFLQYRGFGHDQISAALEGG